MKTRRGYQGNVLLVEMIVVLLFFSLSAVISMGVFVKARQLVDQAALLTAANERMSAWAEELALTPEVEEYLAAQGFSRRQMAGPSPWKKRFTPRRPRCSPPALERAPGSHWKPGMPTGTP